jgi:hypothetical protein
LVLPLFPRYHKAASKNSYQLQKPNGGHSIVILGGKSAHPNRSKNRSKHTLNNLETALRNSSEENMLTLQDDCEEGIDDEGNQKHVRSEDEGRRRDAQKALLGPVYNGQAIIKQTTIDVTFKTTEGEAVNPDGTRRRDDLWMAKELPKIPVTIPSLCPSSSLPFIYALSRLPNKFHLFPEELAPHSFY